MDKLIKINLGCGLQCPSGWINIDSSMGAKLANYPKLKSILKNIPISKLKGITETPWPKGIKSMNLIEKFKFENNSVSIAYTSHVIEHFTYEEAIFFLMEIFRVLKPGGSIRIVTPDLEVLINDYLENKINAPENAAKIFHDNSYFFEIPYNGTFMDWMKLYYSRKNNHHFIFDESSLNKILKDIGFSNVKRSYFEDPESNIIFREVEEKDRAINALIIEAVK